MHVRLELLERLRGLGVPVIYTERESSSDDTDSDFVG